MRRLVLAAALLIGACSSSTDLGHAYGEIAKFHAQLNNGQFDEIYALAGPEWKRVTPHEMNSKLFGAIHAKLGSFVSGKQLDWRENYTTAGTFLIVRFDSRFQKGVAQETFTYRKSGDQLEFVGYNVNSPLFLPG